MMTEAEEWLNAQPKLENGKVDILLVIAEGQTRGYCICPKPMRDMINFTGLTCAWCGMEETIGSYNFWYREIENRER